jgi:uncharacterized protein YbcC (UPF0753/DUF2309 family)
MEIAWRQPILRALPEGVSSARTTAPAVQAVFCIDVRSEVFRRALEQTSSAVQTLGFGGFFGLGLEYQPFGAATARPQVPGLLAPRLRAIDTGLHASDALQRADSFDEMAARKAFKSDAISTFAFVDTFGVKHAVNLVRASLGLADDKAGARIGLSPDAERRKTPRITEATSGEKLDLPAHCELALGMLRGMSLTRHFARLVLLVGHSSVCRNNPQAAGLDCGACCRQTGEVNARAGAALLNDPEIRGAL